MGASRIPMLLVTILLGIDLRIFQWFSTEYLGRTVLRCGMFTEYVEDT